MDGDPFDQAPIVALVGGMTAKRNTFEWGIVGVGIRDMTVTIEISDEKVEALKKRASATGQTVERLIQEAAEQLVYVYVKPGSIAHLQRTDPEEWGRQFAAWADSHDPNIPVLSDEDMSRESIY